jgi:hypothetical protein
VASSSRRAGHKRATSSARARSPAERSDGQRDDRLGREPGVLARGLGRHTVHADLLELSPAAQAFDGSALDLSCTFEIPGRQQHRHRRVPRVNRRDLREVVVATPGSVAWGIAWAQRMRTSMMAIIEGRQASCAGRCARSPQPGCARGSARHPCHLSDEERQH